MKTDEELKILAIDLADEKIFTNQHLDSASEVGKYFTTLHFISEKELLKIAEEQPGLIYEYKSNAISFDSDGDPVFKEFKILSKEETIKVFDYYDQYKKEKFQFNENLFNYNNCLDLLTDHTILIFEDEEEYLDSPFYIFSNYKGNIIFKGQYCKIVFNGNRSALLKYSKRFLKYLESDIKKRPYPVKYDNLSECMTCNNDDQSIDSIFKAINKTPNNYNHFIIIKNGLNQ
jgi:hypothetical protein